MLKSISADASDAENGEGFAACFNEFDSNRNGIIERAEMFDFICKMVDV